MWSDFKKFLFRGNVIDLAVAVVIGAAFTAVVNSLVNDIIMPVIGALTAGIDFADLKVVLYEAVMEGETVVTPEVAITYGHLIQVILQFVLVALVIFLIVRMLTKFKKKEAAAPPAKPDDVKLLEEIRDLLKKK